MNKLQNFINFKHIAKGRNANNTFAKSLKCTIFNFACLTQKRNTNKRKGASPLFFYLLIQYVFLISSESVFGQTNITEKYKNQFTQFDSLNNIKDTTAKYVLQSITNSPDFNKNDTLKVLVYGSWERYYIMNGNVNLVNSNCDKCLEIALKNKMYAHASTCLGSNGMCYFRANEIDSAVKCFEKGLEYARLGKDTFNINKSLMALANCYSRQSKYNESNKILLENVDKIYNKGTQAVAYATIADNYMALNSTAELDHYYIKAINNLRGEEYTQLLWGTIHRYGSYLYNKEKYDKVILYADSIAYFGKNDIEAIATSKTLKASAYFGLKDYKNALVNTNETIKYDEGNDYLLADDYKLRGKIYYEMGNSKEAIIDLNKSLQLFGGTEETLIKKEILEYLMLSTLLSTNADLHNKLKEYIEIKDLIYKKENIDQLAEFDIKYKSIQKDAIIKQTRTLSKTYLLIGILATLSTLILSFLFYKIRKQKKLIEFQKQEIFHNNSNSLKQLINIFKNQPITENNTTENQERMEALSLLNRMLYENGGQTTANINDYLPALCNVKKITTDNKIDIQVTSSNITLGFNQLKDIGLIVNELTMNAIKYAFTGVEKPLIKINVSEKENYIHLIVHDNGQGIRSNTLENSKGFGLKFVQLLVKQYDGTINTSNENGAKFDITLKKIATQIA